MREQEDDVTKAEGDEYQRTGPRQPNALLGFLLILSAGLYRPIVLWAENAWEVSTPEKLVAVGIVLASMAAIPYAYAIHRRVGTAAAASAVGGTLLVMTNWHRLQPSPLLWLFALLVGALVLHRYVGEQAGRAVVVTAIAVLFVAPTIQLGVAHVRSASRYPVVELSQRVPTQATGIVRDVVLVVVDSYPSLALAEDWYSHSTDDLDTSLSELGYTVEETAWSQAAFTALAVPSLLELKPVVEPGPKGPWGNRMSTYEIIRGDSLVAESLRSAGFEYTHIEGGWDAASCGDFDVCNEAAWLDEAIWELFRPSIAYDYLAERYGDPSSLNSLRAVEHLTELEPQLSDERLDFVFVHVLLPHSPYIVDSDCAVLPEEVRSSGSMPIEVRVSQQLGCADKLIAQAASVAGPASAIIITGDHGTGSQGQVSRHPNEWSDSDIAERLGVFLAYRLPVGCDAPASDVNTDVMRAIMSCAVNLDLPDRNGQFFIGANDPVVVDPIRMARIQREMDRGAIPPPAG